MNLTSPILKSAVHLAEVPGNSVNSFLKMIAGSTGLFSDSPDGVLGMLMSGLAGVAAAIAVALGLTLYFGRGYRSFRDVLKHSAAAFAVLGLLAFVAYDMRNAALAYLGINPAKPAVEFEIRVPNTTVTAIVQPQVELRTDRNQVLAQVKDITPSDAAGRSVLRGLVALDYRTRDRVVLVHLPGQTECEFKLRLAASPSHSDEFGPWHLADRVVSASRGEQSRSEQNDAFAIRYRVL